jgi:3-oxoacyl-[acyl-carrier-protein] synthase-3
MTYHGLHDGDHMQEFYHTLNSVCVDEQATASIVKTAKVVARLYRLQLEEVEYGVQ